VREREAISVTWYTTEGTLESARTGIASFDPSNASRNVFTAPTEPGPLVIWAVVRDERGGTDFRAFRVMVNP
jgi:hypothetical protein